MNGRILYLKTPAARIAALLRSVLIQRLPATANDLDYRDIETILDPFMEREEYLVRVDQVEKPHSPEAKRKLHERLTEIETELAKVNLFEL